MHVVHIILKKKNHLSSAHWSTRSTRCVVFFKLKLCVVLHLFSSLFSSFISLDSLSRLLSSAYT